MIRTLLVLLTLPGLASFLLFVAAAQANSEIQSPVAETVILDLSLIKQSPQLGSSTTQARSGLKSYTADHPFLEFTVEESETAAALFGCDCPYHINQVRQMRGQPLLQ